MWLNHSKVHQIGFVVGLVFFRDACGLLEADEFQVCRVADRKENVAIRSHQQETRVGFEAAAKTVIKTKDHALFQLVDHRRYRLQIPSRRSRGHCG